MRLPLAATYAQLVVFGAVSFCIIHLVMRVIKENPTGPEQTFPSGFKPSTYIEAVAASVSASNNDAYSVDFKRDWCIGPGMRVQF
jgi:hypothetical protein